MPTTAWKGRLAQAAARYGEISPAATTCCNTCRTCVQTNLLAAALTGLAAASGTIVRFARRLAHP
jgi:hypothetical protein